jgi:hypothetical protein
MLESVKSSIALILDEITERPTDRHALQEALREKIAELQAMGLPVPEDFLRLEAALSDPGNDAIWDEALD